MDEGILKFSPRVKFIAITVDELLLVPVVIALAYFFAPEILVPVTVLMIVGAAVFVAVKYRLIYDSLRDGPHPLHTVEGMRGIVIDDVSQVSGKIKVGAEIWDARCDGAEITKGVEVVILSLDGLKVRVRPAKVSEQP
ncbi:MAG: NfeD family protein [Candidatus Thorarchaeota archaeon]